MHFGLFAAIAALHGGAIAASTFQPARPPAIPLAVKSPYLNIWLKAGSRGGNGGYLAGEWPVMWNEPIAGWQGFIRVDGTVYRWMGAAPGALEDVKQTEFSYTSSKSTFIMDVAGKVQMNITFLSPITPMDLKRQSLTFSYLNVQVQSLDGTAHSVQLYSDVSAELASGDKGEPIQWDYGVEDGVAYHRYYRRHQVPVQESWEQPDWGYWYWSTRDSLHVTYQSGRDRDVRGNFMRDGKLPNTKDTRWRPVTRDWPVFGFAVDLGSVWSAPVETLFSLGVAQVEAIDFQGMRRQIVPNLWTSYFKTELESMLFVYNDYPTINAMADALDAKIAVDSIKAGGQDYLTLTSLSLRQVFGALQFTGTPDRPLIFIKEISSNSDIQTVDVIFPAHPALLYLNPALLRYLLDPLFENQESGRYPKTSAIHDLGTFPVARGYPHGNDEEMPLEECGNMIIMALAYAQRTGDLGYLAAHYAILRTWAGYLIEEALVPQYQLSTDDFAGKLANQTNLALKGIIALEAMAQISKLLATSPSSSPSSLIAAAVAASRARGSSLSYADDALQYSSVAASYMTQWQTIGAINHRGSGRQRLPHATLSYDDPDSHGLLYNLFADRLLDTKLVPHEVYDMQARWYPTVALRHGVPLDTRHRYTKADWMMFCAAATMPPPELSGDGRTAEDDAVALATRDMFISKMAAWVSETRTHRAMTDLYDAETGDYPGLEFVARPVMGAMFALLSLEPYTEIKLGRGQLVSQ